MSRLMLTVVVAGCLAAGAAQAAGDVAAGKAKAAACGGCHGASGQGTQMAPKLAGMAPATFIQDMQAYKSGQRSNAMMKAAASGLSDADIANLAAYYASLK